MGRDHPLGEIENVRAGQRLTAGEEHPFGPKGDRLVDRVGDPFGREPLLALRSGRHQTVTAAQVAKVVDLDPQLLQPLGLQVGRPAEIRRRRRPIRRQEPVPEPVMRERLDLEPGTGDVQTALGRMVAHDLRERGPSVKTAEQSEPALVGADPVWSSRVERNGATWHVVYRICRRTKNRLVFKGDRHKPDT